MLAAVAGMQYRSDEGMQLLTVSIRRRNVSSSGRYCKPGYNGRADVDKYRRDTTSDRHRRRSGQEPEVEPQHSGRVVGIN